MDTKSKTMINLTICNSNYHDYVFKEERAVLFILWELSNVTHDGSDTLTYPELTAEYVRVYNIFKMYFYMDGCFALHVYLMMEEKTASSVSHHMGAEN